MSRTRLLRRLERLTAEVEALESVIDTRGLEALSDEQLSAWCFLLEEGGVESRPRSEQVALWERLLSDPEYVVSVLLEYEPEQRPTAEPVRERVPAPSLDSEDSGPAEEPPEPPEVEEEPPVSEELPEERSPEASDPPRIRRSNDLPESKAEERARLFELDTVRLAEPEDVPGSGFGRWFPPRRRRSRRF